MTTREVLWRAQDEVRRQAWRRRQVRPGDSPYDDSPRHDRAHDQAVVDPGRRAPVRLPPGLASAVPVAAAEALTAAADGILAGRWVVLGAHRKDVAQPDWFFDPVTGRRAPHDRYAFGVNPRSEEDTGNVKQVWELSRHHHLTILAAAWWLTGEERYADVVAQQLESWWQANPFLSGVHWTSGIELAIRLIAWTWVRRLLDGWPGAAGLFEDNPACLRQIHWHQQFLAAFTSRGTSANNHVIAEAAGQLIASCAFPCFVESERWRRHSSDLLTRELDGNTFPSGVNRELASEYHCFVAELGLVAAIEAQASGHPLSAEVDRQLCRMVDAAAGLVDEELAGPRQGDGDDGHVLTVDGPPRDRWRGLLTLGATRYRSLPWWPPVPTADVRSTLLSGLAAGPVPSHPAPSSATAPVPSHPAPGSGPVVPGRPQSRPWHFADAGLTILRTPAGVHPEIWCRADAGPHGYLAIAAHGHADALSVEVRHGGTEVLADPGTYCYHGDPQWRTYFRSTVGHNTMELGDRDQSTAGGPFLWLSAATTRELAVTSEEWSAEHDGYGDLEPPARHRRRVRLDAIGRRLTIVDQVISAGRHHARLAFHLGPDVVVHGTDIGTGEGGHGGLHLTWPGGSARLHLPTPLAWHAHRGETDPVLGWYSPSFGRKQPATTLVGTGEVGSADSQLMTLLEFHP
jgi:hypothetical protein